LDSLAADGLIYKFGDGYDAYRTWATKRMTYENLELEAKRIMMRQ
jgi:hypothetical protein